MIPKSGQDLPGVRFLAIGATPNPRGRGKARPAADRAGGRRAMGTSSSYILFASGKEEEERRSGEDGPEAGRLLEKRQRARVR